MPCAMRALAARRPLATSQLRPAVAARDILRARAWRRWQGRLGRASEGCRLIQRDAAAHCRPAARALPSRAWAAAPDSLRALRMPRGRARCEVRASGEHARASLVRAGRKPPPPLLLAALNAKMEPMRVHVPAGDPCRSRLNQTLQATPARYMSILPSAARARH